MYAIQKCVRLPDALQLPTNMYKMEPVNRVNSHFMSSAITANSNNLKCYGNNFSLNEQALLLTLEERQKIVLDRLMLLQKKLNDVQLNEHSCEPSLPTINITSKSKSVECKPILNGNIVDLVVSANPKTPPYSLIFLRKCLENAGFTVCLLSRIHSSILTVAEGVTRSFCDSTHVDRSKFSVVLTIHWKDVPMTQLMVNPLKQTNIDGEENIIRYICRMLPPSCELNYEQTHNEVFMAEIDYNLEQIQNKLGFGNNRERQAIIKQLNARLGQNTWIIGKSCSAVDVLTWSLICQLGLQNSLPANLSKWCKTIDNLAGVHDTITEPNPELCKQTLIESYVDRQGLENYLHKLAINFCVCEHVEVFTVEALVQNVANMPGLHMKNLFLKDKKYNLYLLAARWNVQVKLTQIAKQIGTKDLRFGDEKEMFETLHVKQGSVTPFALINDVKKRVILILDKEAIETSHSFVNFHPMVNTATMGVSPIDFFKFLNSIDHQPTLIEFS